MMRLRRRTIVALWEAAPLITGGFYLVAGNLGLVLLAIFAPHIDGWTLGLSLIAIATWPMIPIVIFWVWITRRWEDR